MNEYIKIIVAMAAVVIGMYSANTFADSQQKTQASNGDLYKDEYIYRLPLQNIYKTGGQVTKPSEKQNKGNKAEADAETATAGELTAHQEVEADLAAFVRGIVFQLFESGGEENLKEHAVAVSTIVNLNSLYRTSSLGRYLSEQLIGELHRAGVEVVDVRKTPGLMISQENGEYSLSRDMDELIYVHKADTVLVGTYTFVDERLFINVRLLSSKGGRVLASASAESPVGSIISQFLADEGMPVKPARPIEVRTLVE